MRSIPVRKVFGDLKEKSPLGMMQGCQHLKSDQGGLQDELYTKSQN